MLGKTPSKKISRTRKTFVADCPKQSPEAIDRNHPITNENDESSIVRKRAMQKD
jgi:hypothetical protein